MLQTFAFCSQSFGGCLALRVTIIVAGLTGSGTQSAGEFAASPEDLEKVVRNGPADWQKKNMEVILQTTVTDSVAGPPQVVASYHW